MSFPDIADTFQPRLPGSGPFIPGGGGGGPGLRNAKFVDPNTDVPLADQTGSDEAPYATCAQAIAALELVGGGALLLNPGQYPAEVLAPATPTPLTLRGLSAGQGAPCDLSLVSLANKEALAIVDVFAIGELKYSQNFYLENSNVSGSAVLDAETPEGNALLINSEISGQLECDQGQLRQSNVGFFFCNTGSAFLTESNVVTQLTCSGNLVANGLVGQNSIPAGTTIDTTVTAAGYTLSGLTCFRIQNAESCRFVGTTTLVDSDVNVLRNCTINNGAVFTGPAGSTLQVDTVTYAAFLEAGASVAGGMVLEVVGAQPHATISIVVPALAAAELGYATGSLVGTILEGITANTPIQVTATQDLTAAGAGRGGVLANSRISATDVVKVPFYGALAGGASNFIITRL